MVIHEYGDSTLPKVLLLHPMLAESSCMRVASESMEGSYCFIIPDLSGHGEDIGVYKSARQETEALLRYLREMEYREIELLMGASLGGLVGLYLLGSGEVKVKTAVFEGTPAFRSAPLICAVMQLAFLVKHRKAVKMPQSEVEKVMEKTYGAAFSEPMARNFRRIDEASIKAIVHDCGHVEFPVLPESVQRRMIWAVGGKDINVKQLKNVRRRYPCMKVIVQEEYGHCAYLAEHYREYGALLEQYMEMGNKSEVPG